MTKDFLLDKNILITGATSGIGKSLTKYLSEHGANILMLSKDESKLDVLYDEIVKKYNTDPCIFKCDLQKLNEDSAIEINKIINENYSGIDAVIFNAAALDKMSHIESYDLATWEKILKINLTSIFLIAKNLIPLLKESSNPRIIFTNSSVGKKGKAFWGAYSVSKAGLNALSEIIADEVESVSNIKVFNFDPKATRTKMRSLAYPAENPNTIKDPLKLMDYYLWMLSEDSSSSNEIHIEYRSDKFR